MSNKLTIDPDIRGCIPDLRPEEKRGLEEDIKKRGCVSPFIVWRQKNTIVDGHHRNEICVRLGLGFAVKMMDFADKDEVISFVRKLALHRRNLTDYQRGAIALELKEEIAAEAQERMLAGKPDPVAIKLQGQKTDDILAERAGISATTLRKVETIEESGTSKLKALASTGEVSISAAAKVATLPKSEQREIIKEGPEAIKEAAAEIKPKPKISGHVKDMRGNVIEVDSVAEIFARRGEIQKLMTAISKLKTSVTDVAEKDPLYSHLNISSFTKACNDVHQNLRFTIPFLRCPECIGGDDCGLQKNCRICKGNGWLNERMFDALPAKHKEEAKQ